MFLKFLEHSKKTPTVESLFNKVAALQDCCKTYFYMHSPNFISPWLNKTLKNVSKFL